MKTLLKLITFSFLSSLLIFNVSCDDKDTENEILTIDFESVQLNDDGLLHADTLNDYKYVEMMSFYGSWDEANNYLSGMVLSNNTDTETPGYENQWSVYAGTGANGSSKFVAFNPTYGKEEEEHINFGAFLNIRSISFSNTTYAALTMLNGNSISKKFSYDDKDWFKATIELLLNGDIVDTQEVWLADFRTESSSGILNIWKDINFSDEVVSDALRIKFESSDYGDFGMNTPAYIAIDDIKYEYAITK